MLAESLAGATDQAGRRAVRAPVRGVVNKIAVTTIGGVIAPGGPIMEIVPIDDKLLIEARIAPKDVAFIRPGQKANVKLTAYDYSIYGSLKGEVTQVSANTITDPNDKDATYYRVIVETGQNRLQRNGVELTIIPSMQASIEIQTGEKTVFDYIMKPVNKVRSEALRER